MDSRVFTIIETRDGNQRPWVAIAPTGDLDLGAVEEELRAVLVGCIVDANVLDP